MADLKKTAAFAFALGYLMRQYWLTFQVSVEGKRYRALWVAYIVSFVWYNIAAVFMWATVSKGLRNKRVLTWVSAVVCFLGGERDFFWFF